MAFEATRHPVLRVPSAKQAAAMGQQRWIETMVRREDIIRQERHDPLRAGWEAPVWKVGWALLGVPWIDAAAAEAVRKCLGFAKKVKVLLVLGGNRASKSEWAAKTMMRLLCWEGGVRTWSFHSSSPMSNEYQQPLFWRYMPPEYRARNNVRGEVEYIAYKQKRGFAEDKFVLQNASEHSFKNYEQDMTRTIEGGEINAYWADEHVPVDWIETLGLRIATREGFGIVTFTPTHGYSATVKLFQDGAECVRDAVAFLLPKDEGDPDYARALGFRDGKEMTAALKEGRTSIPEDCAAWVRGESGQPAAPEGRRFEMVPRVLRCVNENHAVLFFHSSDNPYGKPQNVLEEIKTKPVAMIRERFYGIAHKTIASSFPKFSPAVHVLPAAAIPTEGTRVLVVDPASGRNMVMKWYIFTKVGLYLYREWPGNYEIPGVGVPGPWALPDGKHPDGKPGPAQVEFGWGLLRYKEEIARLEGWQPLDQEDEAPDLRRDAIRRWKPVKPRERVMFRMLDSRAATSPRMEDDRPKTLLTDFEEIGLFFELTPGDDIGEGKRKINDALDYDENRPVDFFNKPFFYVSELCKNSIFALQTWTGLDGQKGATKDFVDCDRYLLTSDLGYLPVGGVRVRGGGSY